MTEASLRASLQPFARDAGGGGGGGIGYSDLAQALAGMGVRVAGPRALRLARRLDPGRTGTVDLARLAAAIAGNSGDSHGGGGGGGGGERSPAASAATHGHGPSQATWLEAAEVAHEGGFAAGATEAASRGGSGVGPVVGSGGGGRRGPQRHSGAGSGGGGSFDMARPAMGLEAARAAEERRAEMDRVAALVEGTPR